MTTQDDGFDARQAARDELAPDGKTLALMLENIVAEGAAQIRMIRSELEKKARSPKGLSGRTLVGVAQGGGDGDVAGQGDHGAGRWQGRAAHVRRPPARSP
jgi:hypothetical protein